MEPITGIGKRRLRTATAAAENGTYYAYYLITEHSPGEGFGVATWSPGELAAPTACGSGLGARGGCSDLGTGIIREG